MPMYNTRSCQFPYQPTLLLTTAGSSYSLHHANLGTQAAVFGHSLSGGVHSVGSSVLVPAYGAAVLG